MTAPVMASNTGPGASARRVSAMVLRYLYLYRSSPVRVLEHIYWPLVQMLMWGFLQGFLARNTGFFAQASGLLIGSVLLWDILFRGKIGFSISFLEEMWSRNLGQLLISPLTANEFLAALSLMSLIRIVVGMGPVVVLAYFIFDFNLFTLGAGLAGFFVVLVLTSWALGMVSSGIVLRFGLGAEEIAWSLAFVLLPLCCVYYPVSALPAWLQPVSLALPPTHVFEGMREILLHHRFEAAHLWRALALNVVYLAVGYTAFHAFLRAARANGSLLQMGE